MKTLRNPLSLVIISCVTLLGTLFASYTVAKNSLPYPIVGTGQDRCYNNTSEILCPAPGTPFSGQDSQSPSQPAAYQDNRDGTVSDRVTGLMWAKAPSNPITWAETKDFAARSRLGGYQDWRVPSIKELYSLREFVTAYRLGKIDRKSVNR